MATNKVHRIEVADFRPTKLTKWKVVGLVAYPLKLPASTLHVGVVMLRFVEIASPAATGS